MINIIFDFEGVFWDSMEATVRVYMAQKELTDYEQTLHDLREDRWSYATYVKNRHYTLEQSTEILANKALELDQKVQHGTTYFINFAETVKLLQLKLGPNLRMALLSTALPVSLTEFAAKFNLHFTHCTGFHTKFSKEEEVEKIARDWNIPLNELYFVTDTLRDIRELKPVMDPSKLLGCAWGWHGTEYLKRELPESQILIHPEDIKKFIKV